MTDVHAERRAAVHDPWNDAHARPEEDDMDATATPIMIGSRVYGRDGYVGIVVGTRERAHARADVLVRLSGPLGRWRSTRVMPAEWVKASERVDRVRVEVDREAVVRCPHLRGDAQILVEASRRSQLAAQSQWTREVGISVRDGVVRLRCYPADERAIKCATEAVAGVPGVLGVEAV